MFDGIERDPPGFFTVQEALALVAYGDPTALDRLFNDEDDHEIRLREADRALCDAVAEGAVIVLGRRGVAEGKGSFFPGIHETIPANTFLNKRRTFIWSPGWVALDCGHGVPWDEWLRHRVTVEDPDWGELRFPKSVLLARFPVGAARLNEPGDRPPAAVIEWMRRAYQARPQPKGEFAISGCMVATGATYREARAALALVEDRRKRGRPRKGVV